MKTAAPSRRDRLRQMRADLRLPGALEAHPWRRGYAERQERAIALAHGQ